MLTPMGVVSLPEGGGHFRKKESPRRGLNVGFSCENLINIWPKENTYWIKFKKRLEKSKYELIIIILFYMLNVYQWIV